MRKNIFSYITILLSGMVLFNACKKNNNTNNTQTIPSGYKMNASQSVENQPYSVELWSKHDSLYVGYNNIYIAIKNTNTNEYISDAGISIRPYMPKMPMMGRTMPYNNPIAQTAENNLFACGASFTMASNANDENTGLWNLEVKAKLPNVSDSIKAICAFNVPDKRQSIAGSASANATSGSSKEVFSKTLSLNGQSYRVELVAPREFIAGSQPIIMRIFQKIGSGATSYFQAIIDDNLKVVDLNPTMPDMGHGSPNNVSPILNISTGAYTGTITFTMTGLWDIAYTLTDGTNTAMGTFTIIL